VVHWSSQPHPHHVCFQICFRVNSSSAPKPRPSAREIRVGHECPVRIETRIFPCTTGKLDAGKCRANLDNQLRSIASATTGTVFTLATLYQFKGGSRTLHRPSPTAAKWSFLKHEGKAPRLATLFDSPRPPHQPASDGSIEICDNVIRCSCRTMGQSSEEFRRPRCSYQSAASAACRRRKLLGRRYLHRGGPSLPSAALFQALLSERATGQQWRSCPHLLNTDLLRSLTKRSSNPFSPSVFDRGQSRRDHEIIGWLPALRPS